MYALLHLFFLTSSNSLLGLYLLWKIGIAHGDISLSNMMYYEENGELYGVLNDFDLAAEMEVGERSPKTQGFERTGTLPFMALDLLDNPDGRMTRWFRHDLEACMWCILLHSLKQERVDLYSGPPSIVSDKKWKIMGSFGFRLLKEEWEDYFDFLCRWTRIFRDRKDDRQILTRKMKTDEESLIALQNADRRAKDENYMGPDAKVAKDELGNKRAKALEDLAWIDVKVDINTHKEE